MGGDGAMTDRERNDLGGGGESTPQTFDRDRNRGGECRWHDTNRRSTKAIHPNAETLQRDCPPPGAHRMKTIKRRNDTRQWRAYSLKIAPEDAALIDAYVSHHDTTYQEMLEAIIHNWVVRHREEIRRIGK
jgi:hypothetical protein